MNITVAILLGILGAGCSRASPTANASPTTSASCAFEGEPPLDVTGQPDGVYAIDGGRLGARLARFENMTWETSGVDAASGKRWVRVHLGADDAEGFERFTAGPPLRRSAVVIDGRVAAQHKVRTPLTSPVLQVSCCDPRACDAWEAKLKPR